MRSEPSSATPWEMPPGAKSSVMVAARRWFQTSSNQRFIKATFASDMVGSSWRGWGDGTTRVNDCEVDFGLGGETGVYGLCGLIVLGGCLRGHRQDCLCYLRRGRCLAEMDLMMRRRGAFGLMGALA